MCRINLSTSVPCRQALTLSSLDFGKQPSRSRDWNLWNSSSTRHPARCRSGKGSSGKFRTSTPTREPATACIGMPLTVPGVRTDSTVSNASLSLRPGTSDPWVTRTVTPHAASTA